MSLRKRCAVWRGITAKAWIWSRFLGWMRRRAFGSEQIPHSKKPNFYQDEMDKESKNEANKGAIETTKK
jgi:hypothetical protein